MANYNKQFNFRNGVQVDDDNLVVNAVGLVGIGTTIPTENLDVRGNAKISGFSSATSTFTELLTVNDSAGIGTINLGTELIGAGVSIRNGIVTAADSNTGIVTFYGDARFLQGMPTSQWIDIDVGLGFTSIYNRGFVGVATDDPRFSLQIGGITDTTVSGFGTGVGISSVGNVLISGITTSGTFVGIGSELQDLDASRITYGTIGTERLPVVPNDRLPRNVCQGCDQIHYENPKIIVGSLPVLNNSVLLCKRAIHPSIGMWTIPSGFMELGESLEDGARREALEEANLTFEIIKLYGNYSIPEIGQVLFVFLVNILNKDYAPMDETSEVQLFNIDNIPWSKIAFPSVEYFLKNYVQDHKSNNFRFHSNFNQKHSNSTI